MTPDLDPHLKKHAAACYALHREYPIIGASRAYHANLRGQPMSFASRPFLLPLYAVLPRLDEFDICKGVQTGVSEFLIQLALHEAGWQDRIVSYVLPTIEQATRFASERIDSLLETVHEYKRRTPRGGEEGRSFGAASTKRKAFGKRGSMLFLGSNSTSEFSEFSADTMIIDESDLGNQANIEMARDRLLASSAPRYIRISNPWMEGGGIDEAWQKGSRARWLHRCGRCGERQALSWTEHFVHRRDDGSWWPRDEERIGGGGDLRPVCQRCHRPFEREATGGVWMAEYPQRRHTFQMSRLDILAEPARPQPIRDMFAEWIRSQGSSVSLKRFHVSLLGWSYSAGGVRLTRDMLEAVCTEPPTDHLNEQYQRGDIVIMGVDVGALINVTISKLVTTPEGKVRRAGRWIGAVRDFEQLDKLIEKYRVRVTAIDVGPETRKVKELIDRWRGATFTSRALSAEGEEGEEEEIEPQVWAVRFGPAQKFKHQTLGLTLEYNERLAVVNRTELLDETLEEFVSRSRTLPVDADLTLHFFDQMKAPVRKITDAGKAEWDEGSAPDHYRLADAYERVAAEIYANTGSGSFDIDW